MDYQPNWIELDGVVNMRDLAGLPAKESSRIAERAYLRSGNLDELGDTGQLTLLRDYSLSDVIDLRTFWERRYYGVSPLERDNLVRVGHFTVFEDDDPHGEQPMELRAVAPAGPVDPELHVKYLTEMYLGYLESRPENLVSAVRSISQAPGTVVVHCTAGKDRTGVVTALALGLLGVDPELIAADYEVSGTQLRAILERIAIRHGIDPNHTDMREEAQATPSAAMLGVLAGIEERHGGIANWFAERGWTAADQTLLENKLLV